MSNQRLISLTKNAKEYVGVNENPDGRQRTHKGAVETTGFTLLTERRCVNMFLLKMQEEITRLNTELENSVSM